MKTKIFSLLIALSSLFTASMASENLTVQGIVVAENGKAIAGAKVQAQNTAIATKTNANGEFILKNIPATVQFLQISASGYVSGKVKIRPQKMRIVMKKAAVQEKQQNTVKYTPLVTAVARDAEYADNEVAETVEFDEFVVVGYAPVAKRDVTSSIASVSGDNLKSRPVNSASEMMQGKIAGVQVKTSNGSPDADVQVRVRGGSSITQSSEPLYIVDGKAVQNIDKIPADKIKSVDVLKDASATAIYGARGANGVIVINTKPGTKVELEEAVYLPPPPPRPESRNNEEYNPWVENRFEDAKIEPLSTFSLDVDAASYSNVRRIINNGQMPKKNTIRVEEFINYFSYDYPQPTGNHPVKIVTEMHACPWNKEHRLVQIGVKAKEIPSDNFPASNFVFLIDVSGSMDSPRKLPLVKSSMKLLLNNLRDEDRVAIVTYANNTNEVLQSTPASDKQKIMEAIDALYASGGTAGGDGIQRAYRIAEKNFIKGGNNRIVLCTDGDFNIGISNPKDLEELIETKRKSGVYLTVLGYGMGNYKDNRLQTLSEKGNGNHAYIDNIQEANKVLVNEFGSTMYAVAKDVKIQVEFNPAQVSAYRLIGYESRLLNKEDFNDDTKDAGELGAGHTVTAFYEIIPVGVENRFGGVDALKYQQVEKIKTENATNELMTVKLRYKPLDSDVSLKMEIPVSATMDKTESEDFIFASSVAMFAQLLRDSDFKGDASYADVAERARQALGEDKHGYRREFVRLVEAVEQLAK
ncbi:MAG: von Willebrand factor type A domain-containing protein [Prevotellaceae bacterium]|jgi:Ca-activated chloride channel family protein|nr:von Willebrand factor type A domain-containing protein [Prevotellaceae bacterium]